MSGPAHSFAGTQQDAFGLDRTRKRPPARRARDKAEEALIKTWIAYHDRRKPRFVERTAASPRQHLPDAFALGVRTDRDRSDHHQRPPVGLLERQRDRPALQCADERAFGDGGKGQGGERFDARAHRIGCAAMAIGPERFVEESLDGGGVDRRQGYQFSQSLFASPFTSQAAALSGSTTDEKGESPDACQIREPKWLIRTGIYSG